MTKIQFVKIFFIRYDIEFINIVEIISIYINNKKMRINKNIKMKMKNNDNDNKFQIVSIIEHITILIHK